MHNMMVLKFKDLIKASDKKDHYKVSAKPKHYQDITVNGNGENLVYTWRGFGNGKNGHYAVYIGAGGTLDVYQKQITESKVSKLKESKRKRLNQDMANLDTRVIESNMFKIYQPVIKKVVDDMVYKNLSKQFQTSLKACFMHQFNNHGSLKILFNEPTNVSILEDVIGQYSKILSKLISQQTQQALQGVFRTESKYVISRIYGDIARKSEVH